tara:strand:+ start:215 stop:541 length:327 start_codon:yes stop_codon:yes gene_type:complete
MNNLKENQKPKSELKIFFIKLISIVIAIVITINLVFNIIFGERLEQLDDILSLNESNYRVEFRDKIRKELNRGLNKDSLIHDEDKVLLYKLYQKIISEFKDIDKSKLN